MKVLNIISDKHTFNVDAATVQPLVDKTTTITINDGGDQNNNEVSKRVDLVLHPRYGKKLLYMLYDPRKEYALNALLQSILVRRDIPYTSAVKNLKVDIPFHVVLQCGWYGPHVLPRVSFSWLIRTLDIFMTYMSNNHVPHTSQQFAPTHLGRVPDKRVKPLPSQFI